MARITVLLWATFWAVGLMGLGSEGAKGIGVNWGSLSSHNLLPSVVAQMLTDNGIEKVKLFDADSWKVKAFAGTGIEVILGIPNEDLKRFSDDYDEAKDWVKENVTVHMHDGGVDIKYIAVGNEAFLKSYNNSYLKTTLPAMKNIQKALNDKGLGNKIKVTTPLNADVYTSGSSGPSEGDFRPDLKNVMLDLVRWMDSNGSPFLVNIYPFLSLYDNPDFPVDYAFFDGHSKPINDNGNSYTNMFDANLDTLVYALKKAGVPDMKIIVGEAGWPTDGDINANVKLAKRFYNGFLKRLASNKGTPLRPGHMEVYLFGLLDEDVKSIAPGSFERHWGIFRYDGMPKFAIDFSGKSTDKWPVAAKGVEYLEKQWCTLNKDVKNLTEVSSELDFACASSDCTSLMYGSTCNNLDLAGNISYAFNMYFQMNDQDVEACNFNGMASISNVNRSKGSCLFPVQIQSDGMRIPVLSGFSVVSVLMVFLFTMF